jgi:hypothetical protein
MFEISRTGGKSMNERIRELAEQTGWAEHIRYKPTRIEIEKFAELIVRECAELATKEYDNRGAIHGNDLLQHFGVEE